MHHVIREVGIERIVMGSDYCFGIGDDHPVATVNRFGAVLSAAEREMILGRNATILLNFSQFRPSLRLTLDLIRIEMDASHFGNRVGSHRQDSGVRSHGA